MKKKDQDKQVDPGIDPDNQMYPAVGWSDPYEPDCGPEDEKEK